MAGRRDALPVVAARILVVGWGAWWAWGSWSAKGLSWHFFADGSRLLVGGSGLNLYADHPELQTGPLSLALAALLLPLPAMVAKNLALIAMAAAGPLLVAALAPLVAPQRRRRRMLVVALLLTPAWTVLSVRWGHLDDVLAMTAAIAALRAVCADRPVLAGAALAAAVACKPWAIGFLPLLLVLPAQRLRAVVTTVAGTLAAWGPFLAANAGTLRALHPPVGLSPASGLHTLGVHGRTIPPWGRAMQLVLAPMAALAASLTRRWEGVLLVAVAVRLALDPQDNAYYIGSAVLAAAVFDLLRTCWTIPWTTLLTGVVLWQPFVHDYAHRLQTTTGLTHWWFAHQATVGRLHLIWSLVALALVVALPRSPGPQLSRNGAEPLAARTRPWVRERSRRSVT